MAQFEASARTNRFLVKDVDAFVADMHRHNIGVWVSGPDKPNEVAIYPTTDYGTWPYDIYDEETDEELEFEIEQVVVKHLIDGSVAVFYEVGAEKLRYVAGRAFAVNSAGQRRVVDLDAAITAQAKELGADVLGF